MVKSPVPAILARSPGHQTHLGTIDRERIRGRTCSRQAGLRSVQALAAAGPDLSERSEGAAPLSPDLRTMPGYLHRLACLFALHNCVISHIDSIVDLT